MHCQQLWFWLLKENSSVTPIFDTYIAEVYPVCMAFDGTALKPGFEVYDRTKLVVGA